MSKKIIGVTVGTPISPSKIADKLKPVKTVNGIAPDGNGNVNLPETDIGIFYIQGGGTTDTTNKVATWTGTHEGITEYYDGLMLAYKIGTAGSTTTTLNINGLGAVPVVKNATTAIGTSFAEKSVIFLTYTTDSGTAYWKAHDYDTNTKTTTGTSNKTGIKLFLVGGASQASSATTYSNSNVFIDTSDVLNSAKGFKGNLTGNADTATKATQDASGNVITDTYETKADAAAKFNQLSSEKDALAEKVNAIEEDVIDIKAESLQQVPLFANSIDECTDTSKLYVLPDGYIYAHKEGEVIEWENAVPKSTTNDGVTIYGDVVNGKAVGYMNGKYLSGVSQGTDANYVTVGFIPYAAVDGVYPNIYVKGLPWVNESHSRLYLFTSAFGNTWGAGNSLLMEGSTNLLKNFTLTELGDNYWSLTPKDALYSNITAVPAYMRMSLKGKGENLIISIGKPIETTITKSWQSTGHAFVPADYEEDILDLKGITEKNADDIADLNEKASLQDIEIAEIKANGTTIPGEVKNAVSALVDKAMSREGIRILRLLISSDAHQNNDHDLITKGNKELGQAQGEILNLIGVDFVANLGDVAWGADTNTVAEVVEQIKTYKRLTASALKGECQLWCEGNHDDGNYSLESYPDTPKLTASALNTLLYSEHKGVVYDLAHAVDGYCYKDFEHLKVRVILLNTEQGDGDGGVMADYQLKWLAETALNMSGKTGWQVMTLAHHMVDHGYPSIFIDCVNIIEAFAKKIKLVNNNSSTEYTTRGGTVIKADYSECACDYIAHFHGHAHAYSVVNMQKYSDSGYADIILPNGKRINEICIPNACFLRSNQYITKDDSDRLKRYTTPTSYEKADVDGQRTSFNLVTVCLDEKIIYADNYGAGVDRVISY